MESSSQWVSKMCRLFYADEYAKLTDKQPAPQAKDSALQTVKAILPKLETRVIEFLSEWLVTLLVPAKNVLQSRSPLLSFMLLKDNFMLLKDYWFRECEKAPCTDLQPDPTLHQNSYRTTQADAYVNLAHQTQAQRV